VIWAVIPAAGRGSRFGGETPKQYLEIAGRPLIAHALDALLSHPRIAGAMVALSKNDALWPGWANLHGKPVLRCVGGGERADSVLAALQALPVEVADDTLVLVHDAARPNLRTEDLDRLIAGVPSRCPDERARAGAGAGHRGHRRSDGDGALGRPPGAGRRTRGQPQGDDAGRPGLGAIPDLQQVTQYMNIRIGQGFDVHAFGEGDHVMLGGVRVPHERGIVAHSDGDVVIHALCDAMLGALALGDIGQHFPPSDPQWKGADSRAFLRHCQTLIQERGWQLGNADITVICERPKVGPHAAAMRQLLASDLGLAEDAVSIKATTTEKLGFTGRGEGIAAMAVCLLVRA
jgi:2-C-methyl-D-erythritol 2,4-cyclodiphosphate synthase